MLITPPAKPELGRSAPRGAPANTRRLAPRRTSLTAACHSPRDLHPYKYLYEVVRNRGERGHPSPTSTRDHHHHPAAPIGHHRRGEQRPIQLRPPMRVRVVHDARANELSDERAG